MLLTKVLYSGTHSGDAINDSDFPQLQLEIEKICQTVGPTAVEIKQLLQNLEELIRTAQDEGNPIVFV